MHWTAGSHKASALDKKHYHFVVEGDGTVVKGDRSPEDNLDTSTGYAAHTRGLNTGSIGVSMCAMANAKEKPFETGKWPITEVQLRSFVKLVAKLSKEYGIEVNGRNVLTHAEVQPTLSVRQNGKWDISWLPNMDTPADPVLVGNDLRGMIKWELREKEEPKAPVGEVKKSLKPLVKSKEVWAGAGAAATGVTGLVGSLTPVAQTVLVGGLTVALLMVSGFLIWNRLNARRKGER